MRKRFFRSPSLFVATMGVTVLAVVSLTGAAVQAQPAAEAAKSSAATPTFHGHVSFYGPGFAGKPTANGERFDPNEMTMAHKSLPFGTLVRVTNPNTNHSVVVRVNDRGPYFGNRVADLSQGAAARLRMLGNGVIIAKMEIIGMAQRLRDWPPQAAAAAVAAATPVLNSLARVVSVGGSSSGSAAPTGAASTLQEGGLPLPASGHPAMTPTPPSAANASAAAAAAPAVTVATPATASAPLAAAASAPHAH